MAYAPIVFLGATYSPYVGLLAKFFIFSSVIHQIMATCFSSMPFAVGEFFRIVLPRYSCIWKEI